ncbi:7162_t:CDS:2 [Dentiscutata erythropus]|uniref:7162_t:CDS:1 n=1 Tax=Dentiscutata erythropus TaxID=1348616 RepID=A0A9N9HQ25_9GLOM|nr:7162_t:CDS:2 [Dentiscutata erythropus]
MSKEKIGLNIRGIKYETLRSTLISQPETLLGTMVQEQNEYINNSVNGNEYFFDRNGEAFYYIMEFYRTGKLLWPTETTIPLWPNESNGSQVTYQQLIEELDYFRINKSKVFSSLASETVKSKIDRFISSLEQSIIRSFVSFDNNISLSIMDNNELGGYDILSNMEEQIEKHLVETFSELELKWKSQRIYVHGRNYQNDHSSFKIDITFSSIKKLLESESAQAYIKLIQDPINTSEEKIILNVGGKKYETFQSILITQPETLLGTMFQDRNKCMRHPINENEYFFDRNSEAFYYIMEFYRTGKLSWPTESGKVTCKQLEEEFDYFQIPFNKSAVIYSSALETIRNNVNRLTLAFEELVIRCCNYLRNYIKLEIERNGQIHIIESNKRRYYYLENLQTFCDSKFRHRYPTIDNMENQIGDHLVKTFSDLELKWEFSRAHDHLKSFITISFSFNNLYKNFK